MRLRTAGWCVARPGYRHDSGTPPPHQRHQTRRWRPARVATSRASGRSHPDADQAYSRHAATAGERDYVAPPLMGRQGTGPTAGARPTCGGEVVAGEEKRCSNQRRKNRRAATETGKTKKEAGQKQRPWRAQGQRQRRARKQKHPAAPEGEKWATQQHQRGGVTTPTLSSPAATMFVLSLSSTSPLEQLQNGYKFSRPVLSWVEWHSMSVGPASCRRQFVVCGLCPLAAPQHVGVCLSPRLRPRRDGAAVARVASPAHALSSPDRNLFSPSSHVRALDYLDIDNGNFFNSLQGPHILKNDTLLRGANTWGTRGIS